MEDISILYQNEVGIVFTWKRCAVKDFGKINLVFNHTGLHLTAAEFICFIQLVEVALEKPLSCKNCCGGTSCKSMLLETPMPQVSFAMSYSELKMMYDLVEGAFFELGLSEVLKKNAIK